eukprot:2806850-Prymnesium_polylepis.2
MTHPARAESTAGPPLPPSRRSLRRLVTADPDCTHTHDHTHTPTLVPAALLQPHTLPAPVREPSDAIIRHPCDWPASVLPDAPQLADLAHVYAPYARTSMAA